jgi:PAS domain-containing protein
LELEKIALRKEVDRNDLVAKATHDVLWDWDLVENTVKWNENYHLLFGTNSSPSDSNVTDWEARLHPDDKDKVLEIVNTGIKEGKSNWTSEYRFRTKMEVMRIS